MTNLVEIRDLKVEATTDSGRRVEIIKGVSLDVAEGEIVALIGESGSGKTTIALTLMGHARPGCRISGGSVSVGGKDMVALSEKQRAKVRGTEVAYVPQVPPPPSTPPTIMDQVIEVTRIHQLMPPDEAQSGRSSCSGRCRCRTRGRSAAVIRTRFPAASCSGCRRPWR
jgi:peptide/nickel transport system ATP-binding protein